MKTLSEIADMLRDEIADLVGASFAEIGADMPLHELGVDSLGLVELFVFIEKQFGIVLMESGITQEDLRTVATLSARIAREQKAR